MKSSTQRRYSGYDLKEKTVVVTGASSGAGMATALEFARHGAKVVLAARNLEALEEVKLLCDEAGGIAIAVKTDVTDPDQVKELAATAAEFGGAIDVWVNNAGVLAAGEFSETPIEIHDQVIRVNLMGYLHGAHAVLPYFKAQQYGVLINNISVGGWIPVPYSVGYSASKYGLRGYSEALRGELSGYKNIHVCDMYPAFLDSPGIQHAANYTGSIIRPAPPVYDPQRLARAIVKTAMRPKNSVTVGSVTTLLKFAHFLLPALTANITGKVISSYVKVAEPTPKTSGNLFAPAKFGTSIHGGWNSQADYDIRKKNLTRSLLVAGLATAAILVARKKLK